MQKRLGALLSDQVPGGANTQVDVPLMEAGLDSLSALDYVARVCKAYGMSLPTSLVFDHPTISALGDFIVSALPKLVFPLSKNRVPAASSAKASVRNQEHNM